MGRRVIQYSQDELEWIEAHKAFPRSELHREFVDTFDREDVEVHHLKALCQRKGWRTGRNGRFKKGNISHNKGKKMPFNENSARTQFKKGNQPHNTRYVGHERISKDGYIEVCIDEPNPHNNCSHRYVLKHRHLWEQRNGPIPKGNVLKCLDGNKQNLDLNNWKLIPRGMLTILCRWYDYDNQPQNIRPTIMAAAELKYRASKALNDKGKKKEKSKND